MGDDDDVFEAYNILNIFIFLQQAIFYIIALKISLKAS
jgi:hypothetical protein